MDTTSHNFTWQTFEFGTIGSSVLNDVAIIDENNILAVGEIYMNDSLGNPDPHPYSVAKWNGKKWELIKLYYASNSIISPIRGITVISQNEIYLASGSIFKWDGSSSTAPLVFSRQTLPSPNASVEKLWSNSSSLIYGVGNVGTIIYYNGSQWRRIESGTTLNINDIWGDYNNKTGEWEILAAGGNILQGGESDRVILKIESSGIRVLNPLGADWPLRTIWLKSSQKYFVAGSGIYEKYNLNQNLWLNNIFDITSYSINKLRGDDINDISAVGGVGEIVHYNGYDWKSYYDQTMLSGGNYYGVSIKNSMIVSTGQNNSKAVVTIGKRTN